MDLHFLLRNGISGGVFIMLFFFGVMIGSPDLAEQYLIKFKEYQSLLAAVLTLTPVIGICLQGLYLIFLYLIGGLFADDARWLVAKRIRNIIKENGAWPPEFRKKLKGYYDDPIFVAFYHSHAPLHLIEWARRRRSYHYLGWTISIGSLVGLLSGLGCQGTGETWWTTSGTLT